MNEFSFEKNIHNNIHNTNMNKDFDNKIVV